MCMKTIADTEIYTASIRHIIANLWGGDEIGEDEAIINWWSEVLEAEGECDLADHYSVVEVLDAIADFYRVVEDKDVVVGAMRKIYAQIGREMRDAEEQARWETRYWHERDYGGRL
jgi:hypothetical protein